MVFSYLSNALIGFPSDGKRLAYELVSDTDLLELVKNETCVLSLAYSSNGALMALYCRDRKVRIFNIAKGRLVKTYNETLQSYVD